MKKNFKTIILIVYTLLILLGLNAQTRTQLTPDQLRVQIQIERERYIQSIVEMTEMLPSLHRQDPALATAAVERYSTMLDDQLSLSPQYRPFSPKEVAYLKGHLRAYEQSEANLYTYYQGLIANSEIIEDQPSMYYMLYLMQMQQNTPESRNLANQLLQTLMDNAGQDKSQLVYNFLWSDMAASRGDSTAIAAKLESFRQTRNRISDEIVPRKRAISDRIQAIPRDSFFANPTSQRSEQLKTSINGIKSDLNILYTDLLGLPGIIKSDEILELRDREQALLDSLKTSINTMGTNVFIEERLVAGRAVVDSLNVSHEYFTRLTEVIDEAFSRTERQYGSEYQDYLDIEAKILLDLVGSATLYAHGVEIIDLQVANQPNMEATRKAEMQARRTVLLNESIRLLDEYDQRYTQFTADNPWKSHYDVVISSYLTALRQKISLETGITEFEYALQDLERRRMTVAGLPSMFEMVAGPITDNMDVLDSQYTFLSLQRDFRLIQYRENRRLANVSTMSYDENAALAAEINRSKQDYINRAQAFIQQYPDFQGFMQPTGTNLVSNADLYYNIAELQYSLDPANPQTALMNYRQVLTLDPQFIMADKVKYNIGFIELVTTSNNMDARRDTFFANNPNAMNYDESLRFRTSDFSGAIAAFRSVVDDYTNSSLKAESMLHLGTIYFLLATDSTNPETNYRLALSYLDPLVADANNSKHYEALYQRGVIHMNFGGDAGYRAAINDYTSLLMGVKTGAVTDPSLVQDYQDAAVDNIAFALIALDGTDFETTAQGVQLEAFLQNYDDETIIARIYDKAAAQKSTELNSPLHARDFLMAKVRRLPNALTNPADVNQTVLLYNDYYTSLDPARQRIVMDPLTYRFNQYRIIIEDYGKDSAWYQANRSNAAIATQLAVIDSAYVAVEKRLINNFVLAMDNDNLNHSEKQAQFQAYQEHVTKWAAFQELHTGRLTARQHEWDNNLTNFSALLAESSDSPTDWAAAYTYLTSFNDRPDTTTDFRYEGLAFTFAQNIFDDQVGKFEDPNYRPAAGLPQTADSLYTFYQNSALRFVAAALSPANANPQNIALANQTMISVGDMNAQRGRTAEARVFYSRLLEQEANLDNATKRDLYIKMADLAATDRQYRQSEEWYRKALALAVDNQDRAAIQNQIALQIQSSFEAAEAGGDFLTAAQEYLRMSEEYKTSNPQRYLGYQNQAQEAFIKAGRPQSAIDILIRLAGDRTDKAEVYALHYKAWSLADSLMNDAAQTKQIKEGFIARFPASNESYTLQLLEIEAMKANPQTRAAAAEQYMALYEKAKARTIDTGDDTPEEIYLWAINIYIQEEMIPQRNANFEQFIQTYPNSSSTIVFMQSLADYHWAQGDTLTYERYAREIYRKDRTQSSRYQNIANIRLGKIAYDFDAAVINKDWDLAFAKRDAFVALENTYKREGLTFNSQSAYDAFARARTEYDKIQARIAFLNRYDSQLTNLERTGFISKTPGALITFNANTTWRNHLFGGRPNRVPNLQNAVNAEIQRVVNLLNSANDYDLDNTRRLRALDLIGRINEHAKYAIEATVDAYFATANEFAPYKNRNQMSQEEYDELVTNLRAFAAQYTNEYLNSAYSMYLQTYNTYYAAGYRDRFTARAQSKLAEWSVEPDYQVDENILGPGWNIALGQGGNMSNQTTVVTTPNNVRLGKITIPAGNSVVLTKTINTRIQPDFSIVQMIYPFEAEVKINGQVVETTFIPADTLTTGNAMTTRYALMVEGAKFTDGENSVELRFPNESTEPLPLMVNMQVFTSRQRLAEAVPVETVKILSSPQWSVIRTAPGTDQELRTPAIPATAFGIEKARILDMEQSQAAAIWTAETADTRAESVAFEYSFDIATMFREGYIDMVAPMSANVYLNGVAIATAEEFYYETAGPVYYPNRVNIDAQNVVSGRNTLRFEITNSSDFRGFMAEITIKKTIQE